jgi:hypothetical protein
VREPSASGDLSARLSSKRGNRPNAVPHFDRNAVGVGMLYDLLEMTVQARDSAATSTEDANALKEPSLVLCTYHLQLIAVTMAPLIDTMDATSDLEPQQKLLKVVDKPSAR